MPEEVERVGRAPDQRESGLPEQPGSGSRAQSFLSLGAICGLILYAYVVVAVLQLVVLDVDRSRFDSLHRSFRQWPYRVAIALAASAAIFHTLDGLRRTFADFLPQQRRHDALLRALVAFLTLAVGVPAVMVILWPAIVGRLP
ncbi:MAG: hypothetical protein N2037_03925 [Acidimicrobiales bacterium]|nr:hypothetical protein [Acidimicrobiales bacterium]